MTQLMENNERANTKAEEKIQTQRREMEQLSGKLMVKIGNVFEEKMEKAIADVAEKHQQQLQQLQLQNSVANSRL